MSEPATIEPEEVSAEEALERSAAALGAAIGRAIGRAARAFRRVIELVDRDALTHAAQLPAVVVSNLGPRGGDVQPLADDGNRPLVLVHGLAGHPGNFVLYRAWAALHGRTRVYTVDLSGMPDIEAMASRLRVRIAAVIEVNALPEGAQVDLVAHSLGGVVARAALVDEQTASRVSRLVTLGTPHGGTYAARFAGSSLACALRPGAEALTTLGPPPVPTLSLIGTADVLVTPLESARLEGSEYRELEGLTHYSIVASRTAFMAIDRFFDADVR